MTLLKQDAAARQHVKDRFATAVSHLDDVDPRKAKNFANWIQEKAKLFK